MSTSGRSSFIAALFIILQCAAVVLGELRTIDDTYGDSVTGATPTYLDTNCWNQGPNCSVCVSQPDPLQAHNGTWHDTQSDTCNNVLINSPTVHTVSFAFTGTSLSVYCILTSQGPEIKITNLTFDLDGETSASLFNPSINATTYEYQYNVPVYSRSFLNNTQHNFVMSAVQGTSVSLLLFDYATYDYEDDESDAKPSSSQSASSQAPTRTASNVASHHWHGVPVGAIAGGVAGFIAFVVICVCLTICWRRRRRTRRITEMTSIPAAPFIHSTITNDSGAAPVPHGDIRHASQLRTLPQDAAQETGDLDSTKGPPPAYRI